MNFFASIKRVLGGEPNFFYFVLKKEAFMHWSEKFRFFFACLCVLVTLFACGDDNGTSADGVESSSSSSWAERQRSRMGLVTVSLQLLAMTFRLLPSRRFPLHLLRLLHHLQRLHPPAVSMFRLIIRIRLLVIGVLEKIVTRLLLTRVMAAVTIT